MCRCARDCWQAAHKICCGLLRNFSVLLSLLSNKRLQTNFIFVPVVLPKSKISLATIIAMNDYFYYHYYFHGYDKLMIKIINSAKIQQH